jgi:feruloyl esterase
MKKWIVLLGILFCAGHWIFAETVDPKQSCADLTKLALDHTEMVSATPIDAGALALADQKPDPMFKAMPAFCRVVAVARPTADSNIKIEVWLPLSGWNGKFVGVGNGGFAGSIYYHQLGVAVRSGFASGATDAGHTGEATDSTWALGHPEKVIDFGYRAVHSMTATSMAIVQAFYANKPQHTYFSSCSDGGREALMEAQRFPNDYEGILAGAPAYNWTNLVTRAAELARELLSNDASYVPASKVPAINKAVLAACHSSEPGSFLADPRACHFSPDTLVCKGTETDACLTAAQAKTVNDLYSDSHTSDGKLEYHGLLPGGELGGNGWPGWITGSERGKSAGQAYAQGYFANVVYSNADWKLEGFELDRDLKAAKEKTANQLDAVNSDLSAFQARGGKLILYHGWNDPAISPLATIDYYNSVVDRMGSAPTASFVRLFMVPGMQHCAGGPGPTNFGQGGATFDPAMDGPDHNITAALEQWVEQGVAPEQVIGTGTSETTGPEKGASFSEPICAYPKAARSKGNGDKADASNYACVAP